MAVYYQTLTNWLVIINLWNYYFIIICCTLDSTLREVIMNNRVSKHRVGYNK